MLVLKNGTVVDPVAGTENKIDVLIDTATGTVSQTGENLSADEQLDCDGLCIMPGWIDIRAHFHDPGNAGRESIPNGSIAAAHGGFTAVAVRPDTDPPADKSASISYVQTQSKIAGGALVYPTGTATKQAHGEELSEIGCMHNAGAVAFHDGERTLASAVLLHSALTYSSMFNRVIFDIPQNTELADSILMNEGPISAKLGMKGLPRVAEVIQVGRDVRLADAAKGRLHLSSISVRESLKIIKSAKNHGVQVTADVSPVHLKITDEKVLSFDPVYKTFPPLRESDDIEALKQAYIDSTIDFVTSNHNPLTKEEVGVEFLYAPFGASTLEITVGVILDVFHSDMDFPLLEIARKQSLLPREVLGVPGGGFQAGDIADFTIVDTTREWKVDTANFKSRGKNCPLSGETLVGGPIYTLIRGVVHSCIATDA